MYVSEAIKSTEPTRAHETVLAGHPKTKILRTPLRGVQSMASMLGRCKPLHIITSGAMSKMRSAAHTFNGWNVRAEVGFEPWMKGCLDQVSYI